MNLDKWKKNYIGLAVIGGSGAYDITLSRIGKLSGTIKIETPFGDSTPVSLISVHSVNGMVAFISRHGSGGYRITAPDVNYRANIWALKELGTTRILSWSGPGAIDKSLSPGDYVLPEDLIDLTSGRESTFFKGTGLGFIRQNPVFCPQMRSILADSIKELAMDFHDGGVYAVTQGPRLETPAEIRMIERLGGNLVGMTLAPEAFLARELEICYHPCCYVANPAEGIKEMPYRAGELFEGMLLKEGEGTGEKKVRKAVQGFPEIILEAARRIEGAKEAGRDCPCASSMLRYRRAGVIGNDWRTWIEPAEQRDEPPVIDNKGKYS
ncbi:MAG: MTAP family purine nucleoside phosphorylase [Gemmatimonadota bacterium]|nr:MTAP family purine nucleoside phosphorylase [Gemmatimonadota bacterium]